MTGSAFGSIGQRHELAGPDPHRYVMDPEHWSKYFNSLMRIRESGWKKFACGIWDEKNLFRDLG